MSVTFYYAEWCPHCQVTKPAWEKAKRKLGKVKVKQVEEKGMTPEEKMEISGFPTFIVVSKSGAKSTISGERTDAKALAEEIKSKLGGGGARRHRTYRRSRKLRHRTLRNYKALA